MEMTSYRFIRIQRMLACRTALFALIGLLALTGCRARFDRTQAPHPPEKAAPGDYTFQIFVEGAERSYIVYVPTGYDDDRQWPVALMLHGGGGTARNACGRRNYSFLTIGR